MDSLTQKTKAIQELASRGYISLSKFALLAGVSYPTALKLAKDGKVETTQVGSVYRVYTDEVHRFLREGNRQENGSDPIFLLPNSFPTPDIFED